LCLDFEILGANAVLLRGQMSKLQQQRKSTQKRVETPAVC
jgi:hypothetical protein